MFKEIIQLTGSKLLGNYLPCYIISREPMILTSYWHDFDKNANQFLKTLAGVDKVNFLFQLGWHRETDERIVEIKKRIEELDSLRSGMVYKFLCNSRHEEELFNDHGLDGIFCHQNAFLDPARYKILKDIPKKYDAIYIARITPFKRHSLARNIKSLKLIGDHYDFEDEHFEKIRQELAHADWTRKVMSSQIDRYINSAKVGLCLSAEEGAMFVSAEYLLCGLPVVSTRNIGGRDALFEPEYAYTAEDTPESVAEGVEEMIKRNIPPEKIRARVIEKMEEHRRTFIDIVQKIYDSEKVQRDFSAEWNTVFYHKLGLRSAIPASVKLKRGLKIRN